MGAIRATNGGTFLGFQQGLNQAEYIFRTTCLYVSLSAGGRVSPVLPTQTRNARYPRERLRATHNQGTTIKYHLRVVEEEYHGLVIHAGLHQTQFQVLVPFHRAVVLRDLNLIRQTTSR